MCLFICCLSSLGKEPRNAHFLVLAVQHPSYMASKPTVTFLANDNLDFQDQICDGWTWSHLRLADAVSVNTSKWPLYMANSITAQWIQTPYHFLCLLLPEAVTKAFPGQEIGFHHTRGRYSKSGFSEGTELMDEYVCGIY